MTDEMQTNPFADRRVRGLIGLSGGVLIAAIAVFFTEPPLTWVLLLVAVVDVIVTPYLLGKSVSQTSKTGVSQ